MQRDPAAIRRPPRHRRILAGAVLILGSLLPRISAAEPALTLVLKERTVVLSTEDFGHLAHIQVTATEPHEGKAHVYSGVSIRELLALVDAPLGEKLRGQALRQAVLFRAKDGYVTLFALADFDPAFSSRTLILADAVDGKPLSANAGPLRLVVPGDTRAARWARGVNAIDIVQP